MNPYETLGLKDTATGAEIKRAYQKLRSEAHPDREGGSDARMAAINVAYEMLSDPEKRRCFDEYGDPEANVERAALANLEELFSTMIESCCDQRDWVKVMLGFAEQALNELDRMKRQTAIQLGKLQKVRGAVEGNELFERIYKAKVENQTRELQLARMRLASSERTLEIIKTLKPGKDFMESWDKAHQPEMYSQFATPFDTEMRRMLGWRIP